MDLVITTDTAALAEQLKGIPTGINLMVLKATKVVNKKDTGPKIRVHYLIQAGANVVRAIEALWEDDQPSTPEDAIITCFRREYTTATGVEGVSLDAITIPQDTPEEAAVEEPVAE